MKPTETVLLGAILLLAALALASGAGAPESQQSTRYGPDPDHPWNRLHVALAARELAGGRTIGLDELDLLLWPDSDHLLEPARRESLLAALAAFVASDAEGWIDEPHARVLMQQDLWAAFDWAAGGLAARGEDGGRAELCRALADALARVAPAAAQIEGLGGDFDAAVAAWSGAREPDPERPQAPFLPDVDWVRLAERNPARDAPLLSYAHAFAFGGRSLFEVRVAVPGGREATLAWLERLGTDFPPPPPGTRVALVRRLLAFDDEGRLHVTPVVAGVQLRVFLADPADDASLDSAAAPGTHSSQAVTELVLDPALLLAGDPGALRPIGPDDQGFLFVGSHGDTIRYLSEDFDASGRGGRLDTCVFCHGAAGTLSINSVTGILSGPASLGLDALREPSRRLFPCEAEHLEALGVQYKRARFDWGALWAMLPGPTGTGR